MIFLDRAKETTTTTGSSDLVLAGAEPGYQSLPGSFSSDFYYCIAHQSDDQWETGIGNAATGSLVRNTILDGSSGTGVAVSFSAGTKDVFCTFPAVMIQSAKPTGIATITTSNNTPTNITVTLTPPPPQSGGLKFLFVRYSVVAYIGDTLKAWDGTLVYAYGVGATDTPTVIYDPDTTGWAISADISSDAFVVTVTGEAASSTYWKVTASVEISEEKGV
jgi:hypothetical protein